MFFKKKEDKTLILRFSSRSYFLKYIDKHVIEELYATDNMSILESMIESKTIKLGKWSKHIKEYSKVIIFELMLMPDVIQFIKKKNPRCQVYVYYWNGVNNNNSYLLENKQIDYIYSYDRMDVEKYHLEYNKQFYSKNVNIRTLPIQYDVCFIGRSKDRKDKLEALENQLIELGIRYKFTVVEDEKEFISYDQYLDIVAESKCILDVTAHNQNGLSLRCMESIFFQKKLITDNLDIKNYDFYCKENVFLIGDDDDNRLRIFIETPFKPLDPATVNDYDMNSWLKRFK